MEACFLSSNSFTKTMEVIPQLTGRIPTYTRRRSKKYQTKTPFSVACCQASSSSSPHDEEAPLINSDWRSVRARLVARELISPPEDLSAVTDPDAPINHPLPITIGDKWVHKIHEPEKGCLLIATEKLDGVHIFERTVILVLSTGLIGPTGLILNRPSLMSIKEIQSPKIAALGTFSDRPLFFGGPLEEGVFLVSPKPGNDVVEKSKAFDEVMKGLYCGTLVRAIEIMKQDPVQIGDFAQIGDFRFFDGFCAWEREQLREEIRAGYWTVAACSPSVVGLTSEGSVGLWEEILGLMGPRKVW